LFFAVLTDFAVGTVGVVAAGGERRRVAIGEGSRARRVVTLAATAAGSHGRRVGVLECGRRRERIERRVSRRGDPRARVVVARALARGGLLAAARGRRGARLRLDHHPLVVGAVAAVDAQQALGQALGGQRHRASTAAAATPAEHHRGGARRLVLQVHRGVFRGRVQRVARRLS
jgi:hypothetical protein